MFRLSPRGALGIASVCAASFALAGTAQASPEYPQDIERYWRITSLPVSGQGCKLCHSSDLGETGTVVQPFGKTMRAQGLEPEDPTSLYAALGYVTQHSVTPPVVDSDGDGVPDFNEIVQDHTNPNDPSSFVEHVTEPMTNGGAGGDSGLGEGGSAGQSSSGQSEEPPAFEPPSAADLPPPFVHGCSTAPGTHAGASGLGALFVALALGRRRARHAVPPRR